MAKQLDKIVVVDVEATCWEAKEPPPGMQGEIIEVGICLLDIQTLERSNQRSILVKTTMSTVSPFCTRLTGWTQEDVARGIGFAEMCQILIGECGSKFRTWASYGDYDRKQFDRDFKFRSIARELHPFGPTHQNVKNLAATTMGWNKEVGMDEALKRLGLPLEGRHHKGGDDAWNIAAILATLLKKGRV